MRTVPTGSPLSDSEIESLTKHAAERRRRIKEMLTPSERESLRSEMTRDSAWAKKQLASSKTPTKA